MPPTSYRPDTNPALARDYPDEPDDHVAMGVSGQLKGDAARSGMACLSGLMVEEKDQRRYSKDEIEDGTRSGFCRQCRM